MRVVKRAIFWTVGIAALTAIVLGSSWMAWETRSAAIPGVYHADGVWGKSTLTLRADRTFTQEVQFMEYDEPEVAPYPRHVTLQKTISGRWEEHGRSIFDQNISIRPFISLEHGDQGKTYEVFQASFGPVALTGLGIEIDIAEGTVYRK